MKVEFLLLDDLQRFDLGPLISYISSHLEVTVLDAVVLAERLREHLQEKRDVYAIGAGGEALLRSIGIDPTSKIPIKRVWKEGSCQGFTSFGPMQIRASPILVDDVIGSGETAYFLMKELRLKEPKIVSLLYNENPSGFKDREGIKGFRETTTAVSVYGEEGNPYWYPAIYSVRHLLFKPAENSYYLCNIANRYFNGDIKGLTGAVKSVAESG